MGTNGRLLVAAAALLLVASVFPVRARAQGTRQGLWFGFGFGYGSTNVSCDSCGTGPRFSGTSGFLKFGGTLNPHLRVGITADGWTHTSEGETENLGNLTASLYYYPRNRSGLFVEGGVGISSYDLNTSPAISGTGLGLTAAVGYDLPIGPTASLTPRVAYAYGAVGSLHESDTGAAVANAWNQNLLSVALGVTFHKARR
jgi:hypothetical protein